MCLSGKRSPEDIKNGLGWWDESECGRLSKYVMGQREVDRRCDRTEM